MSLQSTTVHIFNEKNSISMPLSTLGSRVLPYSLLGSREDFLALH